MKQYETYKDSRIAWLGKIPGHWEVSYVKHFFEVQLGKMLQPNKIGNEDREVVYLCAANVGNNKFKHEPIKTMWCSLAETHIYNVKKGDLLVVEGGDVGSCVIYSGEDDKYIIQNALHRVRAKEFCKLEYLAYLLKLAKINGYFESICSKATIAHFTKEKFLNTLFAIPTYSEQERIVEYLDAKCGDIDNRIAVLEKEQNAYERLKVAVINRAVTEGLDPETLKRDSGLDWLGMIPEHWEVKRIKALFEERTELSETGEEDLMSVSEYYGVAPSAKVREGEEHITRADSLVGYKKCYKHDLVSNIMLTWKGAIGETLYNGIVSPAYSVYRPLPNCLTGYYHYLFRTFMYRTLFKRNSHGIIDSRLRLYTAKFLSLFAPYPPLSEQKAIVEYLDTKCAAIDTKIGNIAKRIEAYKRLKRALINEVVTGKRAV